MTSVDSQISLTTIKRLAKAARDTFIALVATPASEEAIAEAVVVEVLSELRTEHTLISSSAIASLERENATLTEACGKQGEALNKGIDCLDSVAEAVSRFYDLKPNSSDMLLVSSEMSHALSLTPASVAKEVEEARIGRAVVEWLSWQNVPQDSGANALLIKLDLVIEQAKRKVIAQAREVPQCQV